MSVISIQSHVAFGYVGNSAAVFPLQRLGREVWPIHTVLYSNHPGYGDFAGAVRPVADGVAILDGMAARGIYSQCRAVLSGYLGAVGHGETALVAARRARAARPGALYVCDPVMGDRDVDIYVDRGIPPFMRESALPVADMVTPNHFELQILADCPVDGKTGHTLAEILTMTRTVRKRGPRVVLVTSLERREADPASIEMLVDDANDGAWIIATPRLPFPVPPNGAGDMTAALMTGFLLDGLATPRALERTAAAVFGVLQATLSRGGRELALIAAQDELLCPRREFRARRVAPSGGG